MVCRPLPLPPPQTTLSGASLTPSQSTVATQQQTPATVIFIVFDRAPTSVAGTSPSTTAEGVRAVFSSRLSPLPAGAPLLTRACAAAACLAATDKYRICPANQSLTEECFARPEHQLEFATNYSIIKFATGDRQIKNTIVRAGGGIGWMMNPMCALTPHILERAR
eukprot:COSAG01_NODE_4350_length_5114_cov_3.919242_2_plen_165_part_00